MFICYTSLHVTSITALIIRRSNCINTSSGMISLCERLLGMPVRRGLQSPPNRHTKQALTQTDHTRWCINTIRSPDDERCDARNMQRGVTYKDTKKCVKLVISKELQSSALTAMCWLGVNSQPAHDTATNTEWHLPEAVLIQSVSPDDEHDMLETCREL